MCQIYQRQKKCSLIKIKILFLVFLPFYAFCQKNGLSTKEEPNIFISLDSARSIKYNEHTTPLELVIRNILGIVEVNPNYFIEQMELIEFSAHVLKLSIDSTKHQIYSDWKKDNVSIADSIAKDFQLMLYLKTEFKDDYLFSDSLKFNYRWIRAGQGREAIITVNNDKIYFLRQISGFWKIYVWTRMDVFGKNYERFEDN